MDRLERDELCSQCIPLEERRNAGDVNTANIAARYATKRDERVDISKRRPGMSIHR